MTGRLSSLGYCDNLFAYRNPSDHERCFRESKESVYEAQTGRVKRLVRSPGAPVSGGFVIDARAPRGSLAPDDRESEASEDMLDGTDRW
jgi:hypothetical protein